MPGRGAVERGSWGWGWGETTQRWRLQYGSEVAWGRGVGFLGGMTTQRRMSWGENVCAVKHEREAKAW